jgi:hypothetical protein
MNPISQQILLGGWATGNLEFDVMKNVEQITPDAGSLRRFPRRFPAIRANTSQPGNSTA